jgi:hypothetical protein
VPVLVLLTLSLFRSKGCSMMWNQCPTT